MDVKKCLKDGEFRAFARRRAEQGHVYIARPPSGAKVAEVRVALHDDDGRLVSLPQQEAYLKCCYIDFVQQRAMFVERCGSRRRLLSRLVVVAALVALLLYFVWPMWHVFVNVEDDYHRVLGVRVDATAADIKRAYREQTRLWHPDRRPNCGEPCRQRMVRIQEACKQLLARGETQHEAARRYREQLSALRSLIAFRLHRVIAAATLSLMYAYDTIVSRGSRRRASGNALYGGSVATACIVFVAAFFVAYEVYYMSSVNVLLIGSVVVSSLMRRRMTAAAVNTERVRRALHTDERREMLVCALLFVCSLCCHAAAAKLQRRSLTTTEHVELLCRHVWGVLHVLAYLQHFTPNVYGNVRRRRCAVPLCYTTPVGSDGAMLSRWPLLRAQGSVLLDDVFAFTCRVPSVYRIVVLVTHAISLAQLAWLPRDAAVVLPRVDTPPPPLPVALRVDGEHDDSTRPACIDEVDGASQTGKANALPASSTSSSSTAEAAAAVVTRALSPQQLSWVQNVDATPVRWSDVVLTRYQRQLAVAASPARGRGNASTLVWLTCGAAMDGQVRIYSADAQRAAAAAASRAEALHPLLLHTAHDANGAALLARDCVINDPLAMQGHRAGGTSASLKQQQLLQQAEQRQHSLRTTSQLWRTAQCTWRGGGDGSEAFVPLWQWLRAACALACVAALLLFVLAPAAEDVLRSTATLPPLMRARLAQHAGQITALHGRVLLCAADT